MLEDTIPNEGSQLYNSVSEKERLVGGIRRSLDINYGLSVFYGFAACATGLGVVLSMSMDNPRLTAVNGLAFLANLGCLYWQSNVIEDESKQLERAELELKQIREHPTDNARLS